MAKTLVIINQIKVYIRIWIYAEWVTPLSAISIQTAHRVRIPFEKRPIKPDKIHLNVNFFGENMIFRKKIDR